MHKLKPKLQRQFEVLEKELIPYALIIGPDEVRDGLVNVKTQVCGPQPLASSMANMLDLDM